MAEAEPVQDIELAAELGRDPRESITLHIANRVEASLIKMHDQIQTPYGVFQIIRRSDNPKTSQADFGCMKVVSSDT